MSGPDEPTRPYAGGESPADEPLNLREEWGAQPDDASPDRASSQLDTATQPVTRSSRIGGDELPKKKVRGVARGVNIRTDLNQQQEKLTFRVDRYDLAGNRLTPVPVEMRRYRGGLITDGDEVEVIGRWSRGTLRASRVRNLTTASDVRSWFAGWGKWLAILLALLMVGAIAVVAILVVNSSDSAAAMVKVPNVVGQDASSAENALRAAHLSPQRRSEANGAVPAGTVSATEPPAQFSLPKGSAVTLVVSSGTTAPRAQQPTASQTAPPATVPQTAPPSTAPSVVIASVTGMSGADATNQLRDQGFSVTVTQQPSDVVAFGVAIRTDPADGTALPRGSKVTLIISSGPATSTT